MLYEIFVKAISLSKDEQKNYLAEIKQAHPELFDELLIMIKDDETSKGMNTQYWSSLMANESSGIINSVQDLSGLVISSFKLTELIDKGGMGSVYKAQRCDEQFEQTVAIKIIHSELEQVIGEHALIREAGFMAKLTHPNIGKVFDAGVSDDGHHFIVMEYIDGCSVTEKFEDKTLNQTAKLKLFCDLCDAVNHAHQMQVIHADLKPANILVTQDNQIKILDFGIARMFNSRSGDSAAAYTSYLNAMTASFASPELLSGDKPSMYSDIYALGKIFSAIFTQQNTKKTDCYGELEAITKKATAEIPTERYASVLELKNDITLYINKKVVKAFPASNLYKAKKFVFKRHPITTFLVATLLISITTLTTNLFIQQQSLKQAKEQSDLMVNKFSQLLESADLKKNNGKELLASDILDNAKAMLKEDRTLTPDSIATIKLTLANSYESLGKIDESKVLFLEVIKSVQQLKNKDIAYQAGDKLIQLYLYSNQFGLIQPNTEILTNNFDYSDIKDLPATPQQAIFYHRYLNGMKYHLYQSMPSDMGKQHVELLRNIRKIYWSELTEEEKANVVGSLGGALENQIPIGIEFNFEQTDAETFDTEYKPLIEEASIALQESLNIYTKLDNQIEILKKQLVIGRTYIEQDRFSLGKTFMEKALVTHQKIVGESHPNNIQLYRMMAGFYSYDAPELSLEYAQLGVDLAENHAEVNPNLRLNSMEVQLFALYNTGQHDNYEKVANQLFSYYLALPEKNRNQNALILVAKSLNDYVSTLNSTPNNIQALITQIQLDSGKYLTNDESTPERMKELFTPMFATFLVELSLNNDDVKQARVKYLSSRFVEQPKDKRALYFYKKAHIDLTWLRSFNVADNISKPLQKFTWGSKELRQSVNRLDVLLKKTEININNSKFNVARQLLDEVETLLNNRNLKSNNNWSASLHRLEEKLAKKSKNRV